jgi:hypothetical protein
LLQSAIGPAAPDQGGANAKLRGTGFANSDTSPLRHYCRNPRCRSKLKEPVSNPHKAFCSKGCHASFYLHRCRICERPIDQPKGGGRRATCNRAKCRNARRYQTQQTSSVAKSIAEVPDFIGSKGVPNPDRHWRIVAGPTLSPSAFHYAALPLDRRTAADNARHNKQYYRDAVIETLIGPTNLPINKIPGLTRPRSAIDRAALSNVPIPADLAIPDFLHRARATP